jgi:hypothetical protein
MTRPFPRAWGALLAALAVAVAGLLTGPLAAGQADAGTRPAVTGSATSLAAPLTTPAPTTTHATVPSTSASTLSSAPAPTVSSASAPTAEPPGTGEPVPVSPLPDPLLPPLLLPPVVLNVGAAPGLPVTGQQYAFYVDIAGESPLPSWNLRLYVKLSPGLILDGAPPGCWAVPGGLACWFAWLGRGQTIPLTVAVTVAPGLGGGTPVGLSAVLRYDWALWAYASISRQVASPPPTSPPPTSPPPPPTSPPPPPPVRHHAPPPPRPPAPHHPAAVRAPPARHVRRPRPRPNPPPAPVVFRAMEGKPVAPTARPPSPVVPLGVLIMAVLTPCVAVAATRFGGKPK